MPTPTLRPMTASDVDAAAEMILRNEWGVRREWLEFATAHPACVPLVADAGGEIVATGVGTANGPVGWLGTIFVEPAWRGQGLGRSVTQAILDRLASEGCATIALVATTEGRRLYERIGFEVQSRYRILEAPGLAGDSGGSIRAFVPDDLAMMVDLDREATGEDRSAVLRRLVDPAGTKVLRADGSGIDAFVVRAPWGGGATIARSVDAAMAIVAARRATSGPNGRVRVGVLDDNAAGLDALRTAGFVAQWSAPRMVRGAPIAWHPEWIWGQFNHAMG